MRTRTRVWLPGLVLVVASLVIVGIGTIRTGAQEEPQAVATNAAIGSATASAAEVLTPEQIAAAEALAPPASSARTKPFFPTVDPAEYEAAKAAAASGAGTRSGESQAAVVQPFATPPVTGSFEGVNAGTCCLRPPDTHGAVGPSHFVEAVNLRLVVFNKVGTQLLSTGLAAFFNTTDFISDPRVVYDPIWNRWIIAMIRVAASPTDTARRFFLAVSQTGNPAGAYFKYVVTFSGNAGDWWDYPGLGFDQDAVYVTANLFHCFTGTCGTGQNTFVGGRVLPVAKARVYNGLGFAVPIFGVGSSPQPPLVLDQNNIAVIARVAGNNIVQLHRIANGSNPNQATISAAFNVPVQAYSTPPPSASQPGTTNKLDTLDGRFQNASTQFGNILYQVHTINAVGLPTPQIYKLNWATNTQVFFKRVFATATSHDFNPAVAATTVDRALVVWSSTGTVNAQVRVSGKDAADGNFTSTPGSGVFTSPTFYNPTAATVERWGDYSAVSVDPSNSKRFWFVNEKINSSTIWGSRFGHATFP